MKARHCIALNWLGAGICAGFGANALHMACKYSQYDVTAFQGWGMTTGLVIALAGAASLFVVEPEVWP